MATVKKHLQVFISHCSDTEEHVKVIREAIDNINKTLDDYHLDIYEHKSDTTPALGQPQKVIFEQCPVDTWDIYIGILWHRFGTPLEWEGEKYESGVELEFKEACKQNQKTHGPKILFYKCKIQVNESSSSNDDSKQKEKVEKFFSDNKNNLYYRSYKDLDELKKIIYTDIQKIIKEIKKEIHINVPTSIYNKLEYFSGREWLKKEVDNFLESNNKGYFLIEANAGLGKTTFIAHLVKERKYIHLFCGESSGLEEIAKQLCSEFILDLEESELTKPKYVFGKLLKEAAEKAKKERRKLVIVIDALDEAAFKGRGNVLGLPNYDKLPDNVYFILTARPVGYHLVTKEKKRIRINADSSENKNDIKKYLSIRYNQDKDLRKVLNEENITKEQFIEKLSEKAQGVWIYLYCILEEIREGKRTPLDLDDLPSSIEEYYLKYWVIWKEEHKTEWKYAKKLLVALASLKEPVTTEILFKFTKISQNDIEKFLGEDWTPFIDKIVKDNETIKYRLYHKSLTDFIKRPLANYSPDIQEERFQNELINEFNNINKEICEYYLRDEFFDNFIKELFENKDNLSFIYEYGRKYLIYHLHLCLPSLKENEVISWLQQIIFKNDNYDNNNNQYNLWYYVKNRYSELSEYVIDISILKSSLRTFIEKKSHRKLIPFYIGLILIESTLNSRNFQYPPKLLLQILELDYWPFDQVLFFAEKLSNVQLLCDMIELTKNDTKKTKKLINYAIRIADNITDKSKKKKIEAYLNIIDKLIVINDIDGAKEIVNNIDDNEAKIEAYLNIIDKLIVINDIDGAKKLIDETKEIVNNIYYKSKKKKIEAYLNIIDKLIVINDIDGAKEIVNNIDDNEAKIEAYLNIIDKLIVINDINLKLKYFLDILNSCANMHRKYLLKFLGKSSEIIHGLCETKGLFKTSEMIEQVTTWWP